MRHEEINTNDVILVSLTQTPEIPKTIEIKIAQVVSPEIIYQKINTPILPTSSIPFTPEPTTTNTPAPEPTKTNTPEPTETNTPEPEPIETPAKLITLKQSYIPQLVPQTQPQRVNQRAGEIPGSEKEIWETVKQMLIDFGLWYPMQSIFSIMLIIISVYVILKWIRA